MFSSTLILVISMLIFVSLSIAGVEGVLSAYTSPLDSRVNIPIAIPIENDRISKVNSVERMINDSMNLPRHTNVSSASTCNEVPVAGVTAIGHDGNVPSNVLDKDLNTRWSNLGQGSWIQLDLGSNKDICFIEIAWYSGNLRNNNFVISVSDNGNSFTNVFTGTSSGTTTSPEKYTMPAGTEGRYLRITVNGNTENNWASITEIAVIGGSIFGDTIGSLSHKWQTNPGSSTWSEYASLNGAIKDESDPAIIANADGRLQAFVVGADNALYYKSQVSAGSNIWSDWQPLSGALRDNSDPAVARNSDGRLQVFVIGPSNTLFYKSQVSAGSTTWSEWQSIGGSIDPNTSPVAARNSDGRLQVFVVGADNALYYKSQISAGSNTWSEWQSLGGNIDPNTSPAVARNSDGRLQV